MRPFTITVGDHTFTDADLTGQDLIDAEVFGRTAGVDGWSASDPWAGPLELINVTAVVLARLSGAPYQKIAETLRSSTAAELTSILHTRTAQ